MTKKLHFIFFSIGLMLVSSIQAQSFEKLGIPRYYSTPDTALGLFFDIENLNFFSNNEYNSNVLQGYTTLGTWVNGSIKFRRNEKIAIEGGVQFDRFFGADSMSRRSPFFLRVKFNPIKSLTIIFGELDHEHYWTMPRQLLDIERLYTNSREEGLQIKYEGQRYFRGEIWLNWERMIYRGSAFREQLTAGFTGDIILLNKERLSITVPVNYIAKHWGGEIDVAPELAVTLANSSIGLNLQKRTSHPYFQQFGIKFNAMTFTRSTHSDFVPFSKGTALYPQANLTIKQSNLEFGCWYAENFAAYLGDPYYSNQLGSSVRPSRSMIDMNYAWNYNWSDNLLFSFRTQLYYDLGTKYLDLRAGIILHIKDSFKLRKYD